MKRINKHKYQEQEDLIMVKKKESKPLIEEHKIEGHTIEIRKEGDVEQLVVDGIPRKFFMRSGGYVLYDNVYNKPQKSLSEAVKNYFQVAAKDSGSY